jgi:anti-sigma regulatory factor (Ser/Thr protein kinase)
VRRISLPSRFDEATMYEVLHAVTGDDGRLTDADFEFDFSALGFIEPVGVVSLGNLLGLLQRRGATFRFSGLQPRSAAIEYLDDCGFFQLISGSVLSSHAALRETTFPFSRITHAKSAFWLETSLVCWLAARIAASPPALASLKTCIMEIFNNIRDHSRQEIANIFAQHFPNQKKVEIAVSDFGIGIPGAMRERYPRMADVEAIAAATNEGITSKSLLRNRGAGLPLLIDYVVMRNTGRVTIISNSGGVAFRKDGSAHSVIQLEDNGFYPGTLIVIKIDTNLFVPDDVEREDFEW